MLDAERRKNTIILEIVITNDLLVVRNPLLFRSAQESRQEKDSAL
jgi:hypothetical protein